MLKDWHAAAESKQEAAPKEELQLVPEDAPGDGQIKEAWINEAIQLFGEDLVKIKED
ncbi:hypothetical protein D3C86_2234370 [compost metagenome]